LRRAWDAVDSYEEWTDEAAILEAAGMEVCTVVAGHPNPKLTTAEDLSLIRALRGERR
jgi:2-C-methyl-D-erythritol 4-phosphate cytidylyltransferase